MTNHIDDAVANADAYLNNVDLPKYSELLCLLRQTLPLVDAYRRVTAGDGDLTASVIRHVIAKVEGSGS